MLSYSFAFLLKNPTDVQKFYLKTLVPFFLLYNCHATSANENASGCFIFPSPFSGLNGKRQDVNIYSHLLGTKMQQCIGTVKKSSGSLRIIMFALYLFLLAYAHILFSFHDRCYWNLFKIRKKNFQVWWRDVDCYGDRFLWGHCVSKFMRICKK